MMNPRKPSLIVFLAVLSLSLMALLPLEAKESVEYQTNDQILAKNKRILKENLFKKSEVDPGTYVMKPEVRRAIYAVTQLRGPEAVKLLKKVAEGTTGAPDGEELLHSPELLNHFRRILMKANNPTALTALGEMLNLKNLTVREKINTLRTIVGICESAGKNLQFSVWKFCSKVMEEKIDPETVDHDEFHETYAKLKEVINLYRQKMKSQADYYTVTTTDDVRVISRGEIFSVLGTRLSELEDRIEELQTEKGKLQNRLDAMEARLKLHQVPELPEKKDEGKKDKDDKKTDTKDDATTKDDSKDNSKDKDNGSSVKDSSSKETKTPVKDQSSVTPVPKKDTTKPKASEKP